MQNTQTYLTPPNYKTNLQDPPSGKVLNLFPDFQTFVHLIFVYDLLVEHRPGMTDMQMPMMTKKLKAADPTIDPGPRVPA